MTQSQKIIKYIALSLAILLAVSIITVILSGIYGLSNLLGLNKKENPNDKLQTVECLNMENTPTELELDLNYTSLVIEESDTLKIETTNPNIKCRANSDKLRIVDKKNHFYTTTSAQKLIIKIPKELAFTYVEIKTGAGKVNIEKLVTKSLEMDLGAGKTLIKELISNDTNINTGTGEFTIKSGTINNLDFDIGVGKTTITASITGNSKIDTGVGSLNLNILNTKENYKLKISKGIGSIKVDNEDVKDNEIIGNGTNTLNIDGGVGEINIKFEG